MQGNIIISKTTENSKLLNRKIADNLRRIRRDRGYSQEVLGQMADISQTHISNIENYRVEDVGISTICRLAKALDVSLDYLVFAEELGDMETLVIEEIHKISRRVGQSQMEKMLKMIQLLYEE